MGYWRYDAYDNSRTGVDAVKLQYFKELFSDIHFVNQKYGYLWALFIEGASGNKAYGSYTFVEQGGKIVSFVYVQDLKDRNKYNCYAFYSDQKEMLDNMMRTIFNAIAENDTLIKQGYITESMARWLKEHAKDGEWRFITEAIH